MHAEYYHYLKSLLSEVELSSIAERTGWNLSRELLDEALRISSVSDCPPKITRDGEGRIVSNLPFFVGKLSKAAMGDELSIKDLPWRFAVFMVELSRSSNSWSRSGGKELFFEMQAGGLGYLNASPTATFAERFLAAIKRIGAGALFYQESIVVNPSPQRSERPVPKIGVDWHALCARGRSEQDEDLRNFAVELSGGAMSRGGQLMLLGLLGDRELDLKAYKKGLKGRENLPWYFARFSHDAGSFCETVHGRLPAPTVNMAKAVGHSGRGAGLVTQALTQAVEQVLSFRSTFYAAQQLRRPELLIMAIVKIVQAFYAYYNLPQCRAPGALDPSVAGQLECLTGIARDLVDYSLGAIEFSCEN